MVQDVFLCFNCGTKNRIGTKAIGQAKCGRCGASLATGANSQSQGRRQSPGAGHRSETWITDPEPRPPFHEEPPRRGRTSEGGRGRLILGMAIGGAILLSVIYSGEAGDARSTSRPTPTAGLIPIAFDDLIPELPAQFIQPGVHRNWTGRPSLAPFEVRTRPGRNYFIKLVDDVTNREVVAIYAVGGRTLDILVPLGTYRMRYAAGETWRGEQHLFGPGNLTQYAASDDAFHFRETATGYEGYTVELILQADGNMHTRPIGAADF